MEQSMYSMTEHGGVQNTQLHQQYMEPNDQHESGQSFDVALSKETGNDEISGRQSQGFQGRNSQGGLSLRASSGRPSMKMEQAVVL